MITASTELQERKKFFESQASTVAKKNMEIASIKNQYKRRHNQVINEVKQLIA